MPVTPVLEVAISLALLYLFFSQVVTSIFEMYATAVNKRGVYLRTYLNQALNSGDDKNWAELVYRHPSVDMLAQKTTRPPAYVPSSVFVKAIVDLVIDEVREHTFVDAGGAPALGPASGAPAPQGTPAAPMGSYVYRAVEPTGTPLANFVAGLDKVREGDFKALMRTLLLNARGCTSCTGPDGDDKVFAEFIHGLAVWYDGYMERVSGWYKRDIRWGLFGVGLLVAVVCNLDSLRVASYLWDHSAERQRIVAYAVTQAADSNSVRRLALTAGPGTPGLQASAKRYAHRVDSLGAALQALGFPIGWSFAGKPAPTDSSRLPATFFSFVPATTVRLSAPGLAPRAATLRDTAVAASGKPGPVKPTVSKAAPAGPAVAWRQPAHYLRYQRRIDSTTFHGLMLHRTSWVRTVASSAAAKQFASTKQSAPTDGWWEQLWHQLTWRTLLGWLLMAAALSVGAPFWFQILNRFINVRNLGVPPPTATPAK